MCPEKEDQVEQEVGEVERPKDERRCQGESCAVVHLYHRPVSVRLLRSHTWELKAIRPTMIRVRLHYGHYAEVDLVESTGGQCSENGIQFVEG